MNFRYCPLCASPLGKDQANRPACVDGCCKYVDWQNPKPVVAAVVESNDATRCIALVRRGVEPCAGGWCLPGGFVDPFEDPLCAVQRETREEIGLDIVVDSVLSISSPVYELGGDPLVNQVLIIYAARPVNEALKTPSLTAGDDELDAGWFPLHSLPELCFPTQQEMVQRL